MNIEILKEKEIPLLERKRVNVKVSLESGKTPSRNDLVTELAKKFKTKEDNIIIKHIYTRYGQNASKVIIHIYKSPGSKDKYEEKYLLKKHVKKQEEKPIDEKKQETPKEEKASEVKKEETAPAEEKSE